MKLYTYWEILILAQESAKLFSAGDLLPLSLALYIMADDEKYKPLKAEHFLISI